MHMYAWESSCPMQYFLDTQSCMAAIIIAWFDWLIDKFNSSAQNSYSYSYLILGYSIGS